tara:strand:+ start:1088 stop:1636 length:549 start_codon:yes stop_codon:yes gene_type:complete
MSMALLRVHLGDDETLRSLGLHNTFKTIPANETMKTEELHDKLMQRLVKGLNEGQKTALVEACQKYVITEVDANDPSKMRPLDVDEKAWQFTPKGEKKDYMLYFKHPSEVPVLAAKKEEEVSKHTKTKSKKTKVPEEKASVFGAHLLSISRKSKLDGKWRYPGMIDQTIAYIRENGLKVWWG